ncbi:unnamed protein product [Adineta ricciae]|nr:unnamed protein product [Adineta ricciae]
MSLVLPTGYILDTIGPFRGTMNDASIAERILEINNKLVAWSDGSGQMILDRGFRDVRETFEKLDYETRMPDFLRKGEKQHSTFASSTSRLCTKTRWVVESYQARMKKRRFLDDKIEDSLIPKIELARPYAEEHLGDDENYFLQIGEGDEDILRCIIQSRHSNATRYKSWIQYSLVGDPIRAWYCTYSAGARTIGCCSHIASIIWYLSYARHNDFHSSQDRRRIQQAITETTEESDSEETIDEESSENE